VVEIRHSDILILGNLLSFLAPHKFYVGFRYALPLTQDALQEIAADNVKRVVGFTQYPQVRQSSDQPYFSLKVNVTKFSCTTTGSSLNELYRQLKHLKLENTFQWTLIDRWPTYPGLIKVLHFLKQPTTNCYQLKVEFRRLQNSYRMG
jgi:ferrochelatase